MSNPEIDNYVTPALKQLDNLRQANRKRNAESFEGCEEWSPMQWGCALAGEVGELCNLLKKQERDGDVAPFEIADEIADVLTCLDLLADQQGIDLWSAVRRKFNRRSIKLLSEVFLDEPGDPSMGFPIRAGDFVRVRGDSGSYGHVKLAEPRKSGMLLLSGTYYYGKDAKGEDVTDVFYRKDYREFVLVSREEFMKHRNRRFNSGQ